MVVEGSKDGAIWTALEDGYDARYSDKWLNAYNNDLSPSLDMFEAHAVELQNTFSPSDTILIRFRLYSDPAVQGYGWLIDSIQVSSINEAPTDIALSSNTIDENVAIGTVVGVLSTTDMDVGDTHTYAVSGVDSMSFKIEGNELQTNADLDFETKSSYSITITSTDAGGLSVSRDFTIQVNNVTDIALSSDTVNEIAAIGTVVGVLSTIESDAGDTHTYTPFRIRFK